MTDADVVPSEQLAFVTKLYNRLPPIHLRTWRHLLLHFVRVISQPDNLMTSTSLSIVISPNILRKENGTILDAVAESRVGMILVQFFLEHINEILE